MPALSAIRMERMSGAPSLFLAAQFEIIVQFYFFRDLDGALSSAFCGNMTLVITFPPKDFRHFD